MNLNKLELALQNFSKDAICLVYHLEIPLLEVVTDPRCTKNQRETRIAARFAGWASPIV